MADPTPEQQRALDEALRTGRVTSILPRLPPPAPAPRAAPTDTFGFRVRLDLLGTKPPVWRRLELPGDLTMPRLHEVIQAAMGWSDSHLHRFRTGGDHRSPYFLTQFDLDEGDDGLLEDEVRLDQLLAADGDALFYEYDFGDGWDHALTVEAVLIEPPPAPCCTDGRGACPPEDCGGIGGHADLAAFVRGGYDQALLPVVFDDVEHARDWLPDGWHPDRFDVEETNAALALALAEPVAVTGALADLLGQLERRGVRALREVLARPLSHGPTDVSDDEAARVTGTYRILLDVLGDGVRLTPAGYLPPAVVEVFAERAGITDWWIGKANREDLTPPVRSIRESARALGLVTARSGRLSPTAAGRRARIDPQALWAHIVGRLPLGTSEFDRDAGWLTLAVAGSGTPAEDWRRGIVDLLDGLGWQIGLGPERLPPSAHNPTLDVLTQLAGAARIGWRVSGADSAVAATARAVIRRR